MEAADLDGEHVVLAEHLVVGAGREAQLLDAGLQMRLAGGVQRTALPQLAAGRLRVAAAPPAAKAGLLDLVGLQHLLAHLRAGSPRRLGGQLLIGHRSDLHVQVDPVEQGAPFLPSLRF